jgi:ABC-type multidrug transport system ATPase subunit
MSSDTSGNSLAVELKGLRKSFGRMPVLRDLDLDVPWGEVLTILGPNGSGKTTLIKILATLAKPDSGSVHVAGFDSKRSGQNIRRNTGVVTHDTLLYDDLTGYENLKFFARMFGLDNAGDRIMRCAGLMGMTSRLHDRIGTLSHGMKKRFSIARALLHDPLVLILDEPESGLDQEALSMMENVIRDKSNPHRTVIMTTHNFESGMTLGDRMAILSRGRIAFQESLDAVGAEAIKERYFEYTKAAE